MTNEDKRLYEEKSDHYEVKPSRNRSIDDMLPEWVSNIKRYFNKYHENDHR